MGLTTTNLQNPCEKLWPIAEDTETNNLTQTNGNERQILHEITYVFPDLKTYVEDAKEWLDNDFASTVSHFKWQ